MSKKRGKSPSAAAAASSSKWDVNIATASFSDDTWTGTYALIVANKYEDNEVITSLGEAIHSGQRRKFTYISRDELFKLANELGNPKTKKAKETPANYEVCEAVKPYLDSGEDVPLSLLAKLIKFKLLAVRSEDIKKIEAEKKAKPAAAADKGGKKGGKDGGKERGKSAGKKGAGGKKSPEPPSAKGDTKLRKRGEEDPDAKFIDDEPDDGSSRYFVLSGFNHPQLLPFLAEIGIAPDCIVKMRNQSYERFEKSDEPEIDSGVPPPPPDEKMLALEEERRKHIEEERTSLEHFWRDVTMILRSNTQLKNVAMLEYEVKKLLIPSDESDPEQKLALCAALFEDIACLLYDLLDLRRQWQTYINNLHLTRIPKVSDTAAVGSPRSQHPDQVPTPSATAVPPPVDNATVDGGPVPTSTSEAKVIPSEVDTRYYGELMDAVPLELVSVELLMHAMLEQVEATEQGKLVPSEIPLPKREDNLDNKLAGHFASVALKLALTEEEIETINKVFPSAISTTPKQLTGPELINYHDNISLKTSYLNKVSDELPDLRSIELSTLDQSKPYSDIIKLPRPPSQLARQRAARLQELIHFCSGENLSQEDVDRAFKQFVLECLNLTSTDLNGIVVRSRIEGATIHDIPWDDPYPAFKGMRDIWAAEERQWTSVQEPPKQSSVNENVVKSADVSEDVSLASTPRSGILRRSRSPSPSPTAPRKTSSVHFDEGVANKIGDSPPLSPIPAADNEEVMATLDSSQKRNLDEWCFSEHMEPHILLQTLRSATHKLPFMDTYYHRRDHSLFVILHNPHHTEVLSNHSQWQHWLHADVGFRNYLEHVAESIADWTREQEAVYQATLLQKEVESIALDEENLSKKAETENTKGKKGSAKGAAKKPPPGKKGANDSRPGSAGEKSDNEDIRIRSGSLKALKAEMERIQKEKEEEEKKKADKRSKSADKKKGKDDKGQAADKGGKTSRGSGKGSKKGSRTPSVEPGEKTDREPAEDEAPEEEFWPFYGYDMGDSLVHVSGDVTHMFPTDGGTIRTERVEYCQGTISVRASVLKDNHVFCVHINNPVKEIPIAADEIEKQEAKLQESGHSPDCSQIPTSFFGSITGVFSDGLSIALSSYGPTGEPKGLHFPQPEPYIVPSSTQPDEGGSSAKPAQAVSGKRNSIKQGAVPTPHPANDTADPHVNSSQNMEGDSTHGDTDMHDLAYDSDDKAETLPFQNVTLSTPDGQVININLENPDELISANPQNRRLLIKMSYPNKTGKDHVQGKNKAFKEIHRFVTIDGTVIKTMEDKSTVILYPDGSVAESKPVIPQPTSPVVKSATEKKEEPAGGKKSGKHQNTKARSTEDLTALEIDTSTPCEMVPLPPNNWSVTLPGGERYNLQMPDPSENLHIDEAPAATETQEGNPDATEDHVEIVKEPPAPQLTSLEPLPITVATDPSTHQVLITRADRVMLVEWEDANVTIVEHEDGTRITRFTHSHETNEEVDEETGEGGRNVIIYQYVRVECPGYACLLINQTDGEVDTRIGDSLLTSSPMGHHLLEHIDGSLLTIHADGTVLYTGKPKLETSYLQPNGPPTYVLRHHSRVICEVVDLEGNAFTVDPSGNCHVMLASQVCEGEEGGMTSESTSPFPGSGTGSLMTFGEHAPRFFIVHADGSGTELLRYREIADFLAEAEQDPSSAVIKEEIQDCPHISGITVIQPVPASPSERWHLPYSQASILPAGLKSRDLKNFPAKEEKKSGPTFGSNAGHGLAIGVFQKPLDPLQNVEIPQKKPSQLKALKFRQIVQYRPINEAIRSELKSKLNDYATFFQARIENDKSVEPRDQRTEEERYLAAKVLAESQAVRAKFLTAVPFDDLYNDKMRAPEIVLEMTKPATPQPKRTQADWDRDRRELEEEKLNKLALKNQDVPNYFRSEFGKDFLLTQATDIHHLAKKLEVFPPSNPPSSMDYRNDQMNGQPTEKESTSQSKSTSKNADYPSILTTSNKQNMTSKKDVKYFQTSTKKEYPYYDPNVSPFDLVGEPSAPSQSLVYSVTGELRAHPVPVPGYLRASRPQRTANMKQALVEDPVRRRIYTVGLVGGAAKGQLALRRQRGLDVLPTVLDMGLLREGYTYRRSLLLRNTGVEASRYKVKNPPPASGIRLFYKPGPIAPGLSGQIEVEVYAIAVGVEGGSGIGYLNHQLDITTETDHLVVRVIARVMTAEDYDKQSDLKPAPGVDLYARGPPTRDGIVRPRRV